MENIRLERGAVMNLENAKSESLKRSKEKEIGIKGFLFGNDTNTKAQEAILREEERKNETLSK